MTPRKSELLQYKEIKIDNETIEEQTSEEGFSPGDGFGRTVKQLIIQV